MKLLLIIVCTILFCSNGYLYLQLTDISEERDRYFSALDTIPKHNESLPIKNTSDTNGALKEDVSGDISLSSGEYSQPSNHICEKLQANKLSSENIEKLLSEETLSYYREELITSIDSERLIRIMNKLESVGYGLITSSEVESILVNSPTLTTQAQLEVLSFLEENVTIQHSHLLTPLLESNSKLVAESAFYRLEDIGINEENIDIYMYLSEFGNFKSIRDFSIEALIRYDNDLNQNVQ